jgi:nucleotide-binding universal stress UspA family protein
VLSGIPRVDDELVQEATEALAADGCERARDAGFADAAPVAVEAQHGVAEAIIDAADEHDALLVVMGTRGNTGIRSLLLGSVSHAVAHHAHRPLLIVPSRSLAEARTGSVARG